MKRFALQVVRIAVSGGLLLIITASTLLWTPSNARGMQSAPLLAYISDRTGDFEIYLWDGQETINISQNPAASDTNLVWSQDGRLAWSAQNEEDNDTELYVWDGEQAFNLSQNPAGWDRQPT